MSSKIRFLFILVCVQAYQAFAGSTYQLDREAFASDEDFFFCKELVKERFTVSEDEPGHIAQQILEDVTKKSAKIQLIQDEKRTIEGEVDSPYQGPFVDRIYIVKYEGLDLYKFGLYSTLQILNFKNGVVVERKPLNYFSSQATLNQVSCQKVYYKKVKI